MFPIVVQTISTEWTKRSRGGAKAARRNSVPDILPLQVADPAARPAEVFWHELRFVEPDFVPRERLQWTTAAAVRVPGVDLTTEVGRCVRIALWGKTLFLVRESQLAVLKFSWAEDVMEDGWRSSLYHKTSLHLGNVIAVTRRALYRRACHFAERMRVFR